MGWSISALERELARHERADAESVARALESMVARGELDLPFPGSGRTPERFAAFRELGARELSLARLCEGHADAVAILHEAGRAPRSGCYGVWAADAPSAMVAAQGPRGAWKLRGRKRYASGARRLDRALVTARADDGPRLFDVRLSDPGVRPVAASWRAVGMEATDSVDVTFEDVTVTEDDAVGPPSFYLDRPGFWQGAVGVAACWLGGAVGAYRMLRAHLGEEAGSEHQAAHLGAIHALVSVMQTMVDAGAREIDDDPADTLRRGRERALVVRHVVEQGCQEVLTRVGRASGTTPLAFDAAHARRAADLVVYLRQHHAERDLAALGRTLAETRS